MQARFYGILWNINIYFAGIEYLLLSSGPFTRFLSFSLSLSCIFVHMVFKTQYDLNSYITVLHFFL